MDVPKVEGVVLVSDQLNVPRRHCPADDVVCDYKDDFLSSAIFAIDQLDTQVLHDQPTSVKLEPVQCDEDQNSDDLSTQPSDIHQSSSELHLIEIARHSYPVVLLKRLDMDSYSDSITDCECGQLQEKDKNEEHRRRGTSVINDCKNSSVRENVSIQSARGTFVCDVCGKRFQKALSPRNHERSGARSDISTAIHEERRGNFSCKKCAKRERERERNRCAARKCFQSKLERLDRLQRRVNELRAENAYLASTAGSLCEHVDRLRQIVVEHLERGCDVMMVRIANTVE